jgi:hypothetical protein
LAGRGEKKYDRGSNERTQGNRAETRLKHDLFPKLNLSYGMALIEGIDSEYSSAGCIPKSKACKELFAITLK